MPGGSYFLYTRAPRGVQGGPVLTTAEEASQFLIKELSMVTVPWHEGGQYLRFSATYVADDEAAEDALMKETRRRLTQVRLLF
jgi:LL-diaminopimelate aminotransferase